MENSSKSLSLLSTHLGIDSDKFREKNILNPTYEQDVPLFIDPLLLKNSSNILISEKARNTYEEFFKSILSLGKIYVEAKGDTREKIRKKIVTKLQFKEQPGTGLGYSEFGVSGRGIGKKKALDIAEPVLKLFDDGYVFNNKNIFQVVFLLEDGIGPDLISDMTASIIKEELAEFTQEISKEWNITTQSYTVGKKKYLLPPHPKSHHNYILFLPNDILDTLSVFRDFDGVIEGFSENAKETNESIRLKVSEDIEKILQDAIIAANMANPDDTNKAQNNARQIYKKQTKAYIYNNLNAIDAFVDYFDEGDFSKINRDFSNKIHVILEKTEPFLKEIEKIKVNQCKSIEDTTENLINDFANFVSFNNNIKRALLWKDEKSANEKTWQAIFQIFINEMLKKNNIDITPEYETGMGPVDFKFSQGEKQKILIEIKLSSNKRYSQGFSNQLEIYKKATTGVIGAYFIFINNTNEKRFEKQTEKLIELKNQYKLASKIVLIDGLIHPSASKDN